MMVDYTQYRLTMKEKIITLTFVSMFLFAIGWIFYKSLIVSFLLVPCSLFFLKTRSRQLMEKRKQELAMQFKNALYSLASSLAAGKSVENAFRDVVEDMDLLYHDTYTYITNEFLIMNRRVENGEPIEKAILDFSKRAGIDDIRNFADVFISCKRTGGSMVHIIRRTSNMIGEKLEVQQEINVMIAQKRFESKIVSLIPFLMIAFLTLSSPDYMAPLYYDAGIIIMTVSLLMLLFVHWLAKKIMDLKV